jgi:hypothetical protein
MNAPIHPLFPSVLGYRPIFEVIEVDGELIGEDLEVTNRIRRALIGNGNKFVLFQENLSDKNMAFIVKALEKAPESKVEIIFTGKSIVSPLLIPLSFLLLLCLLSSISLTHLYSSLVLCRPLPLLLVSFLRLHLSPFHLITFPPSHLLPFFIGNTISPTGFSLLCSFLASPSSQIRVLSYTGNNLCDSGAIELSKVLKVNDSLKWILLRENAIGDLGAISIAESFRLNSSLQILDLKSISLLPSLLTFLPFSSLLLSQLFFICFVPSQLLPSSFFPQKTKLQKEVHVLLSTPSGTLQTQPYVTCLS